ncbi:MAG: hypothetical protein SGPRY_007209, partial [Prymnesium sp.]
MPLVPVCDPSVDLALGSHAWASSDNDRAFWTVDGDETTRWASAVKDDEWIALDLGRPTSLCGVDINWEAAFAAEYILQTGVYVDEEYIWTDIANDGTDQAGYKKTDFPSTAPVQYFRVRC